jgi:hypothetical protein
MHLQTAATGAEYLTSLKAPDRYDRSHARCELQRTASALCSAASMLTLFGIHYDLNANLVWSQHSDCLLGNQERNCKGLQLCSDD